MTSIGQAGSVLPLQTYFEKINQEVLYLVTFTKVTFILKLVARKYAVPSTSCFLIYAMCLEAIVHPLSLHDTNTKEAMS